MRCKMKGIGLPIETIVILILAVIVLAAVIAFFLGVWNPNTREAQLQADNTDQATITAILVNEDNNPAIEEKVHFWSEYGIIDSIATVDHTGRATVTLRSEPVNATNSIWAEVEHTYGKN